MINPGLQNRTVLVTGTDNSIGIGAAIAAAFVQAGATPVLHRYGSAGEPASNALVVEGDLGDASLVAQLFDSAERASGPVEVLVNNAAAWSADSFIPIKGASRNRWIALWTNPAGPLAAPDVGRQFQVNAFAPALLMQEFARRHVARGASWGRIVNISTAGSDCFPSEVSYGASKFALESYTRSAASELGQFGITVNVLALGPVQTGWITPSLEQALLPTIPLGRIGTPSEIADVVVFFASEQARWVTGQKIFVAGGHRM
jgi:3-oxoacyl-[acyl-carrier protein] reductase